MATTPAPENLTYLRWVFGLYSGAALVEYASFGLYALRNHTIGNVVDWDDDLDVIAGKAAVAWADAFQTAAQQMSSAVDLHHVDAYQIGPDGKVAHKGAAPGTGDAAWAGTGPNGLPWQCALGVSTSAFDPSGFNADRRNEQGRFYLPAMGADGLGTDGRLTTGQQTSWTAWIGTFLNDVQGMEYPGGIPGDAADYVDLVIYSQFRNKQRRLEGVTSPLTHFRVGRVIDTQRRRRRKLPEEYVTGTVAHA